METGLDEVVEHFLLAAFGIDKVGVLLDEFLKLLLILGETKEIRLFLHRLNLAAAGGALAVYKLALCPEALARCAVESLVAALVNIVLLIELLENLLNDLFVVGVGGADKLVVGSVENIADVLNLARDLIDVFLGSAALCLSVGLNLLTVLVGACLE